MLANYLALDIGAARIGVATANSIARIAAPLPALKHDDSLEANLRQLITEHDVSRLVIGWPRGLNGQSTPQTAAVDEFINVWQPRLGLPVSRQDEAVTSVKAEAELRRRGQPFVKEDIDSLSAVYILEDFLAENKEVE